MAIFDANKTVNLTFYIHLTDPVVVAAKQAMYPEGVRRAPYNPGPPEGGASIEFGAPWRGYTEPAAGLAPFSWSPWSGEGEQDGPYPLNVATFSRHTGGFWGIGGTTIRYYWAGMFVLAAEASAPVPGEGETVAAIAPRRWIEGFETPRVSLPGDIFLPNYSTDAARHVGGRGLAIRSDVNREVTGATARYTPGLVATKSWERFYVRLRKRPAEMVRFYHAQCASPYTAAGHVLGITALGQIALSMRTWQSVETLVGVIPGITLEEWTGRADHDAWVRLDILIDYAKGFTPPRVPRLWLFANGALAFTGELGVDGASHDKSNIGVIGSGANQLELDVDDWHNAAIPGDTSGARLVSVEGDLFIWADADGLEYRVQGGLDWRNGSKIVLVRPSGFSPTHSPNWTGDFRILLPRPVPITPIVELTTTTADALCAVETTAGVVEADPGSIGVAALLVVARTRRGTTSGLLGYTLAGGAPVMVAMVEATLAGSQSTLYAGPAGTELTPVTPIELRLAKGADTGQAGVEALQAQVQLCGTWGPADTRASEQVGIAAPPASTGPHNYPYPHSPWALRGLAAPMAPYIVTGGTYVGNGTGQDLTFRAPVHWLLIRALTGTVSGFLWLSPAYSSHRTWSTMSDAQLVDADQDPTFVGAAGEDVQQQQYRVRIAGPHTELNAIGVTYQYITVADPGMRYMLNGNLSYGLGSAPPQTRNLMNPEFLPGFAFILGENAGSPANDFYAKGPGQAAASLVRYQPPAVVAAALTFAAGALLTDVGLHGLLTSTNSLWRNQDGNADSGEPGVVNFGSYVGDGAASRTFNLSPASGRRPLLAFVFAQSGAAGYQRDPSHTSTNSSKSSGGQGATGITAGGIDTFTVGLALNGTAIVYTYFVLFADATAGNNGWGVNGEYAPVEAYPPSADGSLWPTDPGEPEPEPEPGPEPGPGPSPNPWPGGPPDLPSDFSVACYAWSTYLGNVALSRIGVGKQIEDIRTDASEEGYKIRLHYALDMEQTLRDHPWSFATRYADLMRVAGTATVPVNADWQYSYRAPTDLAFARRIVSQDGEQRAYDPDPPTFRVGADATGLLVYTNAVASTEVPVQLEYTLRLPCAAATGDAIFRTAFVWKLAASLALSLARDAKKAEYCEALYQQTLGLARATGAKEQQQAPAGDADWITGRA